MRKELMSKIAVVPVSGGISELNNTRNSTLWSLPAKSCRAISPDRQCAQNASTEFICGSWRIPTVRKQAFAKRRGRPDMI